MKLRPLVAGSRGLAVAAIAALALGIGLTALMFAIVDGTVYRGLPAPSASEIVHLARVPGPGEDQRTAFLLGEREALATGAGLSDVAAYRMSSANLTGDGVSPRRWDAALVTPGTFALHGAVASVGRTFTDAQPVEGVTPVLISERAWHEQFGGDPAAVGRSVRVNGAPAVIVGVMPPSFRFPINQDVWMPLDERARTMPVSLWGRLASGVGRDEAAATLTARYAQSRAEAGEAADGARVGVEPFTAYLNGPQLVGILESMFLAGLGVLAIACANVANLLLARGLARRREFAIASALGATRWRLMRERLAEGLALATPGALIGIALTYAGVEAFSAAIAASQPPYWVSIEVDTRVLTYVVLAAGASALVAAALPAVQSGHAVLTGSLRDETRSTTSGSLRKTTAALVAVEIALAASVLVCAGLMAKGVARLSSAEYPFAVDGVLTGRLLLPARDYGTPEARREFYVSLYTRLQELRTVREAALGSSLPFIFADTTRFSLDPRDSDQDRWPEVRRVLVSPGYFQALGVGPLGGRDIEESDREVRPPVALVNLSFALTFARREDLIGRPVRIVNGDETMSATIVGIVPDLAVGNVRGERPEAIYLPLLQQQTPPSNISIAALTADRPANVERELRAAIAEIDPHLPLDRVVPLSALREAGTWFYRVFGMLFVVFGFGALVLALVGVYAVMSFAVTRRRREIGTRMALGATSVDIARMFLREGSVRLAVGLAAGILMAAMFAPRLSFFLFQVDPRDPGVVAMATAVVAFVGLAACAVPAIRAARQRPVECLRDE